MFEDQDPSYEHPYVPPAVNHRFEDVNHEYFLMGAGALLVGAVVTLGYDIPHLANAITHFTEGNFIKNVLDSGVATFASAAIGGLGGWIFGKPSEARRIARQGNQQIT